MPKSPLTRYTIAQLEEYIAARKVTEKYEGAQETKKAVSKPVKVKAKKAERKRRGSLNAADIVDEVRKAMPKGISLANLQKKLGTSYPTLKKWLKEKASENQIVPDKADKGRGFAYKIKI